MFMRPLRTVVVLVALAVTGAFAGAADDPPVRFTLGALRRDSVIVPFATWDGKRWQNFWPAPALDLELPITLAGIPSGWWGPLKSLGEWQVYPTFAGATADNAPRTVHIKQPDWVPAHCVRQIALKSDYASAGPVPELTEQPYPKDGLAVAPRQAIDPIEIVRGEAAVSIASSGLIEAFNKAERETASYFTHPFKREERERLTPTVEALYAFGDSPRYYYVEASRLYRRIGDTCELVAFATGWFTREGQTNKWLDVAVDLLPCNLRGATYMLPFGVVRLGARSFWIAQYAGWERERFVIIELKPKKVEVAISTWAGGC